MANDYPLTGVRVLDLSTEIAGPYCAKLWVDAGADVIKLEAPGGDPLRGWTASHRTLADDEDGVLFRFLNASKRSVVADLATAEGRERALALAATVDLVIESAGPGVLEGQGLGHPVLQEVNPALSLVSISPWGQTGPWAARPATEFTLQAATGSTGYRGLPDRNPVAAGARVGEWIAGSFAAVGAATAWLSARSTGRGQLVDVSIFESILLGMTVYHDLQGQWFEGRLPRGVEIPSVEPAKDGWVGLCTITGQQWKDFCTLIGQPELGDDERFYDGRARMEHLAYMHEVIQGWTRERTIDEIVEVASLMRIPAAPVGDGRSLPEMDHFVARGVFSKSPDGVVRPRVPYLLEKSATRPLGPSPRLGADEAEVLAELPDRAPAIRAGEGGPALPLEGLKVVDLTNFWAGPIATSFLSDLGAEVVKVESCQRPDGMRFAGAVRNEIMWEWSPVFAGANHGKQDVTLRLDDAEGRALLERLIEGADVLVENFSARVIEHFGLGWDVVRELNPRLVMVRMPSFGLDGPWRDRTGFAMTVEQVSGLAWMTGYADMPLVLRGACDPAGGMHAVFALLMALEHRRRTGEGQLVEVPLVEVAINMAAEQVMEYSAYGALLCRDENRGPGAAPQGIYRCAGEGESADLVALSVADDTQWQALRGVLGDPDWAQGAALSTAAGRRAAHDELDEQLSAWFEGRDPEDTVEALLAAGVPASVVINAHFVMPNPQLEHREFYQELEHPVTGKTRYPTFPMRYSALGSRMRRGPPPTLGQDNHAILCGVLGLSEEEFEALAEKKVVGTRPTFM